MCRIDDCESTDVWRDRERKARKTHQCDDCRRVIDRGETYAVTEFCQERRWYLYRTCAHCWVGRLWLLEVCSGWCVTDIGEEIGEHWDEGWPYRTLSMGHFLRGHRNRWTNPGGSLMPLPRPITVNPQIKVA